MPAASTFTIDRRTQALAGEASFYSSELRALYQRTERESGVQ
jgi:hypothetical protein